MVARGISTSAHDPGVLRRGQAPMSFFKYFLRIRIPSLLQVPAIDLWNRSSREGAAVGRTTAALQAWGMGGYRYFKGR